MISLILIIVIKQINEITSSLFTGLSLPAPVFSSASDLTEGCFSYPLVEKFLMSKRCSRGLLCYYLLCRGLTFVTLLCACLYLGYYLRLASVTDEFGCELRVGLLANDTGIPNKVQCKLIAVGVFSLLRYLSVQYEVWLSC